MMNESITADLFAALDIVVMEHLGNGSFEIIENVPEWFVRFYPNATKGNKLRPGKKFLFLANFLVDAEDLWRGDDRKTLTSGLWSEIDIAGNEYHFEAIAVFLKKRKILLMILLDTSYEEKQYLIQKARENSLNHHQLLKEIDQKETLIHCLVHDLTGQLTGINYCLELLTFQTLTPKGREYLEKGRKQSKKQEMLIRDMLNAFAAEAESMETFTFDPAQAPDLLSCIKEVVDTLLLTCPLNDVSLQLPDAIESRNWKVFGDKLRLERVISNLLENAFRHSPPKTTVTVGLREDREFIVFTVDDEGSGVTQDISKNLFRKFFQGKEKSGRVGLGLYFCRVTVESWGGTIGYSPRQSGGSQFWFRLPKVL